MQLTKMADSQSLMHVEYLQTVSNHVISTLGKTYVLYLFNGGVFLILFLRVADNCCIACMELWRMQDPQPKLRQFKKTLGTHSR